MQRKSRIVSLNFKDITVYLPFIIFISVYLVGVLIGNLTVGNFDILKQYAQDSLDSYLHIRSEGFWYDVLSDTASNILPVFVLIFVSGTSVIGCICVPIILFLNGLQYGLMTGYLYFTYKLEGVMFNCLILLPTVVVSLFGIVLLCIESFNFSCIISKICIKSEKATNVYIHFKSYCIKSATTLIAAIISIVCDIMLSNLFISFFNF